MHAHPPPRSPGPSRLGAVLAVLVLAACASTPRVPPTSAGSGPVATVYVLRRGWHTELGFPVEELRGPLAELRADFSDGVRYLVFGFADRQYVLATHQNWLRLLLAPLPGDGLMLVGGLQPEPEDQYGAEGTIVLSLPASQAAAIQAFIWASFEHEADKPPPFLRGRYADNQFYASTRTYHGLYTCNTWTADALKAGGLPVSAAGELFAGQVWEQARELSGARP